MARVRPNVLSFSFLPLSTSQHLVVFLEAKDKGVRQRCCSLLSRALDALPDDAELDDADVTALVEGLLRRSADKVPAVRAEAATALDRLQDTEQGAQCPVTARLLEMMQADAVR